MEAEPDFLKLNVVPRRVDVEESSISGLVDEIVSKELWVSYRDARGQRIVKEPRFKEFQKIEYKKEAPSKWEGNNLIADDSSTARRVLDEYSPIEKNRIEEKKGEKNREEKKLDHPNFQSGMKHIKSILNGQGPKGGE